MIFCTHKPKNVDSMVQSAGWNELLLLNIKKISLSHSQITAMWTFIVEEMLQATPNKWLYSRRGFNSEFQIPNSIFAYDFAKSQQKCAVFLKKKEIEDSFCIVTYSWSNKCFECCLCANQNWIEPNENNHKNCLKII